MSARDILSAGLPAGHAVDLTLDLTVDPTVDPAVDPTVDLTPDPTVDLILDPAVDSPLAHARAAITLEVVRFGAGAAPNAASPRPPVLVLLHEGLGCVAMWKDFPAALAAATGLDVVAYSRQGYGRSSPLPAAAPGAARPLDYLRVGGVRELAALLAALALDDVILVGHSDGASIALGYAAAVSPPSSPPLSSPPSPLRLRGVVAMAPHTFIEEVSLAQIRVARQQYEAGPLAAGLARYHGRNVDGAFWGWNAMWLDPAFTVSELAAELPKLSCPVLALQGRQDEYGTPRQLSIIAEQSGGPVEQVLLEDCRHAPHRDQPAATLAAIAAFVRRLR